MWRTLCASQTARGSIAGRTPIHRGDYLIEKEEERRRRSRRHQDIRLRTRLAERNEDEMEKVEASGVISEKQIDNKNDENLHSLKQND